MQTILPSKTDMARVIVQSKDCLDQPPEESDCRVLKFVKRHSFSNVRDRYIIACKVIEQRNAPKSKNGRPIITENSLATG